MGIENLLLCGIFIPPGTDVPMFGNEKSLRAAIHQRMNDVGTSRYQTFMTDPQPIPMKVIRTPTSYEHLAVGKPVITSESSVNYLDNKNKLLGGVVELNPTEIHVLVKKWCKEEFGI